MEGTYFIKTIRPYSRGRDTEIRKAPKVYLCDSGLPNHFAKLDEGTIFENSILQNLRFYGELNYYQRKSGVEIDFILQKNKAYEVKLSPEESDLRKLKELSKSLKLKEYKLISKNYSKLKCTMFGFML